MCGGGGAAKRAAEINRQTDLEIAQNSAKQARLQAQANQQAMEQSIAREKITQQAKSNAENQTVDTVNVEKAPDNSVAIVDPNTGKKRAPRDAFRVNTPSQAGINI